MANQYISYYGTLDDEINKRVLDKAWEVINDSPLAGKVRFESNYNLDDHENDELDDNFYGGRFLLENSDDFLTIFMDDECGISFTEENDWSRLVHNILNEVDKIHQEAYGDSLFLP
jgi:hypothetical protein